jgi:hypothetical protein
MGGKAGTTTGLALLLAAGMAWAGGTPGGEGNRPLSPNIRQPDYILKECIETQPTPDHPSSALRAVDPAGMLKIYLSGEYPSGESVIVDLADIKISLLQGTSHGRLTAGVDNLGRSWYRHDPTPGFLGNDRAIFMAEYGGKRYKIILDIKVLEVLDEKSPVCPEPTLIKVNKPRSDLPLDGIG